MRTDIASFELLDETQTEALGRCFARCLPLSLVVCFQGNLGTGKTTLIRSMIRALGVTGPIKSPTFSIVESYHASWAIHHFDLYRLSHPEELEIIGFRDYFTSGSICLIEWPERAEALLSSYDLNLSLESLGPTNRRLTMRANTETGQQVLTSLLREYGQSC